MSDQAAGKLWTDEEIEQRAIAIEATHAEGRYSRMFLRQDVSKLMAEMRDDAQRTIATLRAELTASQSLIAATENALQLAIADQKESDNTIDKLRGMVAWEPLADGQYHIDSNVWQVWQGMVGVKSSYTKGDIYAAKLPDGWALVRRVEGVAS